MRSAVVATETSAAAAFSRAQMLFDSERCRRRLIESAGDGVTHIASPSHIRDVLFVGELRAVSAADIFCREGLNAHRLFRVANLAIGFVGGFLLAACRRVTGVAFLMRWDGQDCGSGFLLVAEIARELLRRVRQVVSGVQFVLACVEEGVEIVPLWKVALRRSGDQALFGLVTDRAGLLWARCELRDVAFDAGFMTRKLEAELFVAIGRLDDFFGGVRAFVTRITLQDPSVRRSRHVDRAEMRFVRELLVVDGRLWRLVDGLLLAFRRKMAQ